MVQYIDEAEKIGDIRFKGQTKRGSLQAKKLKNGGLICKRILKK